MFSNEQLMIILDAVEEYGVLADEDIAEKCSEILDIIDAYIMNKKYSK